MTFSQWSVGASPMPGWRVGDVVEGLYEVRDVITSGVMGVVYRVHHTGWNIDLAVKTPRPELVSSPRRMSEFETGARAWVGLGVHPHVVSCVFVRRMDGLARVFAEWVDGGNLSEAIVSHRLYAGDESAVLARVLDVAIQTAWGLEHVHTCGVVHQNVKPASVMLTVGGIAKLAGLLPPAVDGTSAPFSGWLIAAYCSPEQAAAARVAATGARPGPLTRASDVWSWAISVWQMFTGRPPVDHGQAAAETFAAFRKDPRVADARIPALPADVAELLGRCLDPDPATRPHRMGELAGELEELYRRLVGVTYPRIKPEPAKPVADGLNNQALSMLDLDQEKRAEQLWQNALETDPCHLHTVYNYGLHRWRRGEITDTELIGGLEQVRASEPGPDADRLLALVHLERNDSATARELLTAAAGAAPEDRAIAAALAMAENQAALPTLAGHTGNVVSVAVSADGRTAVGGFDQTVSVWDLGSGACLRTLTGHTGDDVWSVAVSADGRVAVSGGDDKDPTVRVWDVGSGACRHTLTGHTNDVRSVAVSADARIAVSGSDDKTVRVWDLESGACQRTLTGHTGAVSSVAVSADGRTAVSAGEDKTVRVWDLGSGARRRTLTDHTDWVTSVAVSADARIAVSGSGDETVRVWDLGSGGCQRTLTGHAGAVSSVAVSADGRLAVTAGSRSDDETVRVWDLGSGACLHTLTGDDWVKSVALSADGRVAVSIGYNEVLGGDDEMYDIPTVRVWEVPTARGHRADWSYAVPHSAHDLLTGAAAVEDALRRAETLLAAGDGPGAASQLRTARAVPGHRRDPGLVDLWGRLAGMGVRGRLQDAWRLHTLTGHTDVVRSVAVSADGRVAVSASDDRTVRVWDLGAGACRHTLTGHTGPVSSVAVSADGRIAVSGSRDHAVRVWDLGAGACLHTLTRGRWRFTKRPAHSGWVSSVAVSADGRVAVSASDDRTVRVWDLGSGACLRTLTDVHARPVALSADGRIAVSGDLDAKVRVWDLGSGACLHTLSGYILDVVNSVAVSADGRIAVSGGEGQRVWVWDVDSGAWLHELTGHTHWVQAVAVSADGRVAVSGGEDETVRVWDVVSGACLRTLTGHTGPVLSVAVSADARIAVSGSHDGTVRVWVLDWDYEFPAGDSGGPAATRAAPEDRAIAEALTAAHRQPDLTSRTQTGHTESVNPVAVSANGRVAVSGSGDHTVRVWDLGSGTCRLTLTHPDSVVSVAVSAGGRTAVSAGGHDDKTVRVWDLGSGTCRLTLTHPDSVESVAVSSDGRIAVSAGEDKTVRVWDLGGGACLRTLTGHTDHVWSVAVSADGRVAVSGSRDKTLRVWDVGSGACRRTLTGHAGYVRSVAVSADGRIAVSAGGSDDKNDDKTVRVWDLGSGTCRHILTGHNRGVYSVAVSADGRIAVSGGAKENPGRQDSLQPGAEWDIRSWDLGPTARVWDLGNGACLHALTGHTSDVSSVAVSADGRIAASASDDRTVRVWDVGSGACLRTLTGHTDHVWSVAL